MNGVIIAPPGRGVQVQGSQLPRRQDAARGLRPVTPTAGVVPRADGALKNAPYISQNCTEIAPIAATRAAGMTKPSHGGKGFDKSCRSWERSNTVEAAESDPGEFFGKYRH